MRGKKRGLSVGSILTICLTAVVVIGCIALFSSLGETGESVVTDARRVAGVLTEAFSAAAPPSSAPGAAVRATAARAPENPVNSSAPVQTAAPVATPASTAVPATRTFHLTAAGLAGFQSDVADAFYDKDTQNCDYSALFAGINGHVQGDLNLVTLYNTLTAQGKDYSDTKAHPSAAAALRGAGFDTVLYPDEKSLDDGAQGALDTRAVLKGQGLNVSGLQTADTDSLLMLEKNGVKIAVLAYTDQLSSRGRNNLMTASGQGLLTLYSEETAAQDIARATQQGAEVIIACVNWAQTDTQQVTSSQREIARTLTALGADVILGTRPSRILPVERIVTSTDHGDTHQALVAYSLGTLLTESRQGFDISGALLQVDITVDATETVRIENVSYTPTYIWRQKIGGKWQYRVICSDAAAPADMSQDQKDVMGRALKRVQDALENLNKLQWD